MNDDKAFLQAIIENPGDDGVRLVYADWLEEQGDPRAEIVRLQCTLSHLAMHDIRRLPLESRVRELAGRYGDPLATVPQRCHLVKRGWARRVLKLSGRVNARVEFYGRYLFSDSVWVDGQLSCKQVQWTMQSHFEFTLPGPMGLVPATLDAAWGGFWLTGLRVCVDEKCVYTEGQFDEGGGVDDPS
jgi:uncharacterized protein (TIGR02996 family)